MVVGPGATVVGSFVITKSFRIRPDPLAFRLLFCCPDGADGDA